MSERAAQAPVPDTVTPGGQFARTSAEVAREHDASEPDTAPPQRRRRRGKDGAWPFVFLAPLMLGIVVFYFWPIVATVLNSFSTFGPFGGRTFAGLENYAKLFQDSFIPRALSLIHI